MNKINSFATGLVTGAVVGAAASMLVNPMDNSDIKRVQKNTTKFFSKVGHVVDNLMDLRN